MFQYGAAKEKTPATSRHVCFAHLTTIWRLAGRLRGYFALKICPKTLFIGFGVATFQNQASLCRLITLKPAFFSLKIEICQFEERRLLCCAV